ncbi:MAG: hypothetical protein HYV60_01545 [Planctomycetia bacterium]|nr:hypothetical protein [Planctomycetia bacterium]
MHRISKAACCLGTLIGLACYGLWFVASAGHTPVTAAEETKKKHAVEAVEGDMHEFMGHLYEPTYKRLRQALASKPTGEEAWKHVASDALILAEGGNLLLARSPDSTDDAWASNATGIRTFGSFVYRSAREKDYMNALFYYRHMVEQCNDCHREFGSPDMRLEP